MSQAQWVNVTLVSLSYGHVLCACGHNDQGAGQMTVIDRTSQFVIRFIDAEGWSEILVATEVLALNWKKNMSIIFIKLTLNFSDVNLIIIISYCRSTNLYSCKQYSEQDFFIVYCHSWLRLSQASQVLVLNIYIYIYICVYTYGTQIRSSLCLQMSRHLTMPGHQQARW